MGLPLQATTEVSEVVFLLGLNIDKDKITLTLKTLA